MNDWINLMEKLGVFFMHYYSRATRLCSDPSELNPKNVERRERERRTRRTAVGSGRKSAWRAGGSCAPSCCAAWPGAGGCWSWWSPPWRRRRCWSSAPAGRCTKPATWRWCTSPPSWNRGGGAEWAGVGERTGGWRWERHAGSLIGRRNEQNEDVHLQPASGSAPMEREETWSVGCSGEPREGVDSWGGGNKNIQKLLLSRAGGRRWKVLQPTRFSGKRKQRGRGVRAVQRANEEKESVPEISFTC